MQQPRAVGAASAQYHVNDVVLRQAPLQMAAIVLVFMAVKAAVIYTMAKRLQLPFQERPVFTLLLAQGGEFGFVVFQLAASEGLVTAAQNSALVAAVALGLLDASVAKVRILALPGLLLLGLFRLVQFLLIYSLPEQVLQLGQLLKREFQLEQLRLQGFSTELVLTPFTFQAAKEEELAKLNRPRSRDVGLVDP